VLQTLLAPTGCVSLHVDICRTHIDVGRECRRLVEGFKHAVRGSGTLLTFTDAQKYLTVPKWQRSEFWQVCWLSSVFGHVVFPFLYILQHFQFIINVCYVLIGLRVSCCAKCFCTGQFVMVPLQLTLSTTFSFFEHFFSLFYHNIL